MGLRQGLDEVKSLRERRDAARGAISPHPKGATLLAEERRRLPSKVGRLPSGRLLALGQNRRVQTLSKVHNSL